MTYTLPPSINSKWTAFRRLFCSVTLLWLLAPAVWGADRCDLNSDGQVNVVDVQMGVNQSVGVEPCTSADINSDGQCNVVDVQLLVNTALGDGCPTQLSESNSPTKPWVSGFTPKRIHYVDDVACGGNGTIGSPECESTAWSTSHYQCGDLHIFRAGNYHKTADFLGLNKNCTEGNPAVFKGYVDPATGQQERATTNGPIQLNGDWNWIVNMEVTDNHTYSTRTLIRIGNPGNGSRTINNIIYGSNHGDNTSGGNGTKQVTYGNVYYRPDCVIVPDPNTPHGHNLYMSNDFNKRGWLYIIQNILMETCNSGSKLMNIRTSNLPLSGIHIQDNLLAEAPTSLTVLKQGSEGTAFKIHIHRNYWFNVNEPLGRSLDIRESTPAIQSSVTDNYFAKAGANNRGFWSPTPPEPNIFTGNEIYDPRNGAHLDELQTQGTTGTPGSHKIANGHAWDNNIYGGAFRAKSLKCNGSTFTDSTLPAWRDRTRNCRESGAGKEFDLNSKVVPNPTTNKVVVLKNEYQCSSCGFNDQARGNIYVANWANTATQTVDISSVVGRNKRYVVRYARDFYGTAAASGTCPGSGACNVSLPVRKNSAGPTIFTGAYVITGQP